MAIQSSGAAVVLVASASPTEIPADGSSTSTIKVKVKDQSCKPVPNAVVSLSTNKGVFPGNTTSTTIPTDSKGTGSVILIADNTPGTAAVTASYLNGSETTTVEMKGCELKLSANPQVIGADPRVKSTIGVTLRDGAGVGMSGESVTLSTNFSALTSGGVTGTSLALTTGTGGALAATLQGVAVPQRVDITATAACGATASTFVVLAADEDGSLGPNQDVPFIADPVHVGTGNYTFSKRLFALPGKGIPLDFTVYYNSLASASTGSLGFGWRHSYDTKLTIASGEVAVNWGSGRVNRFLVDGSSFTSLATQKEVTLSKPDAATYEVMVVKPQLRYRFNTAGRLLAIVDASGNTVTLTHSTRLDRITDSVGREIGLGYCAACGWCPSADLPGAARTRPSRSTRLATSPTSPTRAARVGRSPTTPRIASSPTPTPTVTWCSPTPTMRTGG